MGAILSMTGYGQGSSETEGFSVNVEIRSVNNRFCEVSVHMPRDLNHLEGKIRQLAKSKLKRGKIGIRISTEKKSGNSIKLKIDQGAAKEYASLLEELKNVTGLEQGPSLGHLLSFNDIFVSEDAEDPELLSGALFSAVEAAITHITQMREKEGSTLADDLGNRLKDIGQEMELVKERAPARVAEQGEKLKARLAEMIEEGKLDEDRINMEIAVMADKLDVTEEVVRLDSHIQLFGDALGGSENEVGRKLNFVVQEMNREINTIGSKANDAEIAHAAVKMKEELEKIREQVQNIL